MKRFRLILLLFLGLSLSGTPGILLAQSGKKSKRVLQMEAERKTLQKEIARVNGLLSEAAGSTKAQLRQLSLLREQIDARQKLLEALQAEIKATDDLIAETEKEIDILQQKFDKRQESYVKSIRALQHKTHAKDQLLFILSAKDFAEGMRRARYLQEYSAWQKQEAEKLKALRQEIEEQKKALEATKEEKTKLLETSVSEQEALKKDEAKAAEQLKVLQGKEKELRAQLDKHKRQAAELNRQIEAQIRKEIEEAARAARAAEAARRKAESKASSKSSTSKTRKATSSGGYAMTETEAKLSGSFASNKGKLPAPITGSFTVTARFGEQQHEALKYVKVNNAGVDLQGAPGAQARAVFEGKVTRVFTLEGYNNSIIVRHGNYLTVYSNLTEVFVSTGDTIKTGQALGKIYGDPDLGGAAVLHFQVWKETTKMNPLLWIRH